MTTSFTFQAHPAKGISHYYRDLDAAAATLAQALADMTATTLRRCELEFGGCFNVEAHVDGRASHADALADLADTLGRVGYQLFKAEIVELVDEAVRLAIVGAAGGGLAGSKSEQGAVALVGALAGGLAGAFLGREVRRVAARYIAERTYPFGEWRITRVA